MAPTSAALFGVLEHEALRARVEGLPEEVLLRVGGEHHHADLGVLAGDPLGGRDPADARHPGVHQHHLGAPPRDQLERGLPGEASPTTIMSSSGVSTRRRPSRTMA